VPCQNSAPSVPDLDSYRARSRPRPRQISDPIVPDHGLNRAGFLFGSHGLAPLRKAEQASKVFARKRQWVYELLVAYVCNACSAGGVEPSPSFASIAGEPFEQATNAKQTRATFSDDCVVDCSRLAFAMPARLLGGLRNRARLEPGGLQLCAIPEPSPKPSRHRESEPWAEHDATIWQCCFALLRVRCLLKRPICDACYAFGRAPKSRTVGARTAPTVRDFGTSPKA
jgi:hypothetical protein